MRGAGANFGVATAFEFEAHPVPPHVGWAQLAFEASAAPGGVAGFLVNWAAAVLRHRGLRRRGGGGRESAVRLVNRAERHARECEEQDSNQPWAWPLDAKGDAGDECVARRR